MNLQSTIGVGPGSSTTIHTHSILALHKNTQRAQDPMCKLLLSSSTKAGTSKWNIKERRKKKQYEKSQRKNKCGSSSLFGSNRLMMERTVTGLVLAGHRPWFFFFLSFSPFIWTHTVTRRVDEQHTNESIFLYIFFQFRLFRAVCARPMYNGVDWLTETSGGRNRNEQCEHQPASQPVQHHRIDRTRTPNVNTSRLVVYTIERNQKPTELIPLFVRYIRAHTTSQTFIYTFNGLWTDCVPFLKWCVISCDA